MKKNVFEILVSEQFLKFPNFLNFFYTFSTLTEFFTRLLKTLCGMMGVQRLSFFLEYFYFQINFLFKDK